jgi:hypothetical protein
LEAINILSESCCRKTACKKQGFRRALSLGGTFLLVNMILLLCNRCIYAQSVTTCWGGSAQSSYETGFIHQVMKAPDSGVSLFNMELIENDAPGSGPSEKGVYLDTVWGRYYARKEIRVDDPRTRSAWLVIYISRQGKHPLSFSVNGHPAQVENWNEQVNPEYFRWIAFPAAWLKAGKNIIDFSYPQASQKEEGWVLCLARADEFEAGGGDPRHVGETSFKSFDGGKTWKQSPFGLLGRDRAEYTVRLSLDRYIRSGWLETPVIDLWRGDSKGFIVPLRMLRKLLISASATEPAGTKIKYYLRKGTSPDPYSTEWSEYSLIGTGTTLNLEFDASVKPVAAAQSLADAGTSRKLDGSALNRRYIQLRIALSTTDPLVSPVVRSINIRAEHQENIPLPKNIHVIEAANPAIGYSSIPWEWESADRSEFAQLRERQSLDEVIAGSTTEFEAQVRILNHTVKQWIDGGSYPEFPDWNATSILDHINKTGGGGMCLQNNLLLAGFYESFGWQARHVNVYSHELCEVWNDEYGKWIYMEAHRGNHYFYDRETDEPMSILDIHKAYLNKYFHNRCIDWMKDSFYFPPDDHPYAERGSLGQGGKHFNEYCRPAFVRMVPRTNWFSKPYPRPSHHGLNQWPWNGYINWYDEQTPPKRQYSWFTDRPQDMWPDLNTVHIDAVSGYGNDVLYLRFTTYTPNFSHFEVNVNDAGWKKVSEQWAWLLMSGKNTLRARAVNKLGVKGRPSEVVLNHSDVAFDAPVQ